MFRLGLLGVAGQHMAHGARPEWKSISQQLTQTDLDEAHAHVPMVRELFKESALESRTKKTMERIKTKMATLENVPSGEFFKAVSDLIAFRVHCDDLSDIQSHLDYIATVTSQQPGGVLWFKGSYKTAEGVYTDIVQYVYVYIPAAGYIVEFQVGHPFAAYTFTNDSALRDDPNCGAVDMWRDGVYVTVKRRILELANGVKPLTTCKYDMWCAVSDIHPTHEIPESLKRILSSIDGE